MRSMVSTSRRAQSAARRLARAGALVLPFVVACASVPPLPGSTASELSFAGVPAPAGIPPAEYSGRRAALAAAMEEGVLVVFGSAEPEHDYLPYAQNANFRYLTGITEPDAGLVLVKRDGTVEDLLFVRRRDPAREIWEGARLGVEGARAMTGLETRTSDALVPTLRSLLATHSTLHVVTPALPPGHQDGILTREQQILADLLREYPQTRTVSLAEPLSRIRATKTVSELDLIRRATLISALAHREAMRSVRPGMNEFEVQALVEYYFRRNGAEGPAYASIVGSGPNSTTLHYRSADRFMNAGEVVLLDVGASYRGYAADVTRTLPVNGRFTPDQVAVYSIVLEAQKAAERQVRPGGTWTELDAAANRVIADGLARLGLIESAGAMYDCVAPQAANRCPQFRLFFMHGLGHGVGLQVHDPDISYFESFQPGSAFTIEPGIYVRADVLDFLLDTPGNRAMVDRLRPAVERYRNIGVRIEDVYLVTDLGVERVTTDVPREIAEVERMMGEAGIAELGRHPEVIDWYPRTGP
jgi:Xaa-Pro aminopeptidase